MKRGLSYLLLLGLLAVLPVPQLRAQTGPEEAVIVLSPAELNAIIRRMATLRQRRAALLRERQAALPPLPGATPSRERSVDSVVVIRTDVPAPVTVEAGDADYRRELTRLHDRLDRQEMLLLQLLDTLPTAPTVSTTPPAPRRDTVVQRILQRSAAGGPPPSREDLRALGTEVAGLSAEIERLRDRLAAEERRRRRAEEQMASVLRQRSVPPAAPVAPAAEIIRSPSPAPTVRDTVYVERPTLAPVLIPTAPRRDTVVVTRTDTVVNDRPVTTVLRDTVRLAAREPIEYPTIFFANNSSTLSASHRQSLEAIARQVKDRTDYQLRLTGFTSATGSAPYNLELSARRARAVRDGLVSFGVDGARIEIVPGGIDHQPTSAAAARRVEVRALPR